jgi:streptogramin lyase
VQWIDPQTNTVGATLDDAGTTPDGLVELAGAVWVASDSGPQLHRIDPASGTVQGPWPAADQGTISANQLLVAVDGTFWVPLFNQNEVVQVARPTQPFDVSGRWSPGGARSSSAPNQVPDYHSS